ncbi:MAG: NUDIX domain-containing protein [Chloroflexi bacterium]|nr:NUDIX domain-containing protein [Chloroflexota bacterium]
MMKIFLRLWRTLPLWVHILAARIVRPRFRVAVAAMVFDEKGQILLFKHTYRKFQWGIPAGALEHDEAPENAVVREFLEETGMKIDVRRLLLAESSKVDHHVSLIYLCKIVDGEFKESLEICEMKYFAVNDLPTMLFTEKDLIRRVAGILDKVEFKHETHHFFSSR